MEAYLAGGGAYLDLASGVYGLIEAEGQYHVQRVQRPRMVHRLVLQSWVSAVGTLDLAFLGDLAVFAEVVDSPDFAHYRIVG